MGLIKDLSPTNLAIERQKFFDSNFKYDPQFTYSRQFTTKTLTKYGLPQEKYYRLAKKYLKTNTHGPINTYSQSLLSQQDIIDQLNNLCHQLKIEPIPAVFTSDQSSVFLLTTDNKLSVRLPITSNSTSFQRNLDHEIQTHYLRKINNALQPWSNETRPRTKWIRTEEGLAIYNAHHHHHQPHFLMATILYQLAYLAQTHSFSQLFPISHQTIKNKEQAFDYVLRVKRGLTDTSLSGGFTKDIVYWEGYLQIKKWLADPKNNIKDLYWGKISWQEIEELRPRANTQNLIYPTFTRNKTEKPQPPDKDS